VDYVVVCDHEPPFTNSRVVGPNKKVQALFADPFLRFRKTCMFLSGHSHAYERFQAGTKFFIVSGGGGGPRYRVHVDLEGRRFKDLFPGPELRFFHFCEIELSTTGLIFQAMRLGSDGSFTFADSIRLHGKSSKI